MVMTESQLIEDEKECVVHNGFLLKESKVLRNRRKRWFVLTRDTLCAFRRKGNKSQSPTEFIRTSDITSVCSAEKDTGSVLSFAVVTADRTFILIAGSVPEKGAWMSAITDVCFLPQLSCSETVDDAIRPSVSLFSITEEHDESSTFTEDSDNETDMNIWVSENGSDSTDTGSAHILFKKAYSEGCMDSLSNSDLTVEPYAMQCTKSRLASLVRPKLKIDMIRGSFCPLQNWPESPSPSPKRKSSTDWPESPKSPLCEWPESPLTMVVKRKDVWGF